MKLPSLQSATILLASFGAALHISAQTNCFPLPSGAISDWTADGNTTDLLGGNNGVLTNGASYTNGEVGRAFLFTGPQQAVTIGSATNLHLQNFTIEAWIKRNSTTDVTKDGAEGGTAGLIFGFGSQGFGFGLNTPNVLLLTHIDINGGLSTGTISDTNFHHVAVTKDGINLAFYIDGQPAGAMVDNETYTFGGGPAAIGARGDNLANSFDGAIDELAVYNRALSSNEIKAIYNAGSAGKCGPAFRNASAVPQVVNGFVVGTTITDPGFGYTNTPLVAFQGGSGTGATATAVINSQMVMDIVITDPGTGYTNPPAVWIGYPPVINAEPEPALVQAGDTATFSVDASGALDMSYQWAFNGTNIPAATSASLVISNVTPVNLGTYSVTVTNAFGLTNSLGASLSMYPKITNAFSGLVTLWGETNILSVGAEGSGPLTYQWFYNGVAIGGATNQTLAFDGIQFTNAGLYSVVVGNAFGSVTNPPAQIVVNPAGVSIGTYPGITISGTVGYGYSVQATLDLSDTNAWVTIASVTLGQPVQVWVDTNNNISAGTNVARFYRVLPNQ